MAANLKRVLLCRLVKPHFIYAIILNFMELYIRNLEMNIIQYFLMNSTII